MLSVSVRLLRQGRQTTPSGIVALQTGRNAWSLVMSPATDARSATSASFSEYLRCRPPSLLKLNPHLAWVCRTPRISSNTCGEYPRLQSRARSLDCQETEGSKPGLSLRQVGSGPGLAAHALPLRITDGLGDTGQPLTKLRDLRLLRLDLIGQRLHRPHQSRLGRTPEIHECVLRRGGRLAQSFI
jgi:hypothetical protein